MPCMERPVAKVAVDLPLANLDRPFDYLVPPELDDAAQPGVRVKLRFAGQLRDGFILERTEPGERDKLSALHKVISPEPVLHPGVTELIRATADHYAGSFADVVRTAVPPRHAATEKADPPSYPAPRLDPVPPRCLTSYPGGDRFLAELGAGRPRAGWTVLPAARTEGDWALGFVEAAAATMASGRGALLIVPEARSLERLEAACRERFGKGSYAVLAADAGPALRYRNFLAASRAAVRLVIGTRAAIFAPVDRLGLIAVWDDGSDSYAEPHAPYWHAREVAALRAHQASSALLVAGHSRTAEVAQLLERGWLAPLELPPTATRRLAPAVRAAGAMPSREPEWVRLPQQAFQAVRAGLAAGPVLVQVPRAGYLPYLACQACRTPARCPSCGQGLIQEAGALPSCRWCGPLLKAWRCPECGDQRLRRPVAGVARTAEEFGKAFPGTTVIQASADHRVAEVGSKPVLVLATPGAAPPARDGYAAAVLLDAEQMLSRPDLRAGEESLRRWLAVTALVRPAEDGGTVVIVAEPGLREVQALIRLDPAGFAAAELAERRAAGFPPAAKLIAVEGTSATLTEVVAALALGPDVLVSGPFPMPGGPSVADARVTLRCDLPAAAELLVRLREVLSVRAAKKQEPVRVRVDPIVVG